MERSHDDFVDDLLLLLLLQAETGVGDVAVEERVTLNDFYLPLSSLVVVGMETLSQLETKTPFFAFSDVFSPCSLSVYVNLFQVAPGQLTTSFLMTS